MNNLVRQSTLLICLAATFCCGSGMAGVAEGIEAVGKGDYVTALRELRPAAERGNAEAQYRLGVMYEFGRGVAADKAQAMAWFRKAVAQGNASAQLELTPILLGTGKTGFSGPTKRYPLRLLFTKEFQSGNVVLIYQPTPA